MDEESSETVEYLKELNLQPGASRTAVKEQYILLAYQNHPQRVQTEEAAQKFGVVTEACYHLLTHAVCSNCTTETCKECNTNFDLCKDYNHILDEYAENGESDAIREYQQEFLFQSILEEKVRKHRFMPKKRKKTEQKKMTQEEKELFQFFDTIVQLNASAGMAQEAEGLEMGTSTQSETDPADADVSKETGTNVSKESSTDISIESKSSISSECTPCNNSENKKDEIHRVKSEKSTLSKKEIKQLETKRKMEMMEIRENLLKKCKVEDQSEKKKQSHIFLPKEVISPNLRKEIERQHKETEKRKRDYERKVREEDAKAKKLEKKKERSKKRKSQNVSNSSSGSFMSTTDTSVINSLTYSNEISSAKTTSFEHSNSSTSFLEKHLKAFHALMKQPKRHTIRQIKEEQMVTREISQLQSIKEPKKIKFDQSLGGESNSRREDALKILHEKERLQNEEEQKELAAASLARKKGAQKSRNFRSQRQKGLLPIAVTFNVGSVCADQEKHWKLDAYPKRNPLQSSPELSLASNSEQDSAVEHKENRNMWDEIPRSREDEDAMLVAAIESSKKNYDFQEVESMSVDTFLGDTLAGEEDRKNPKTGCSENLPPPKSNPLLLTNKESSKPFQENPSDLGKSTVPLENRAIQLNTPSIFEATPLHPPAPLSTKNIPLTKGNLFSSSTCGIRQDGRPNFLSMNAQNISSARVNGPCLTQPALLGPAPFRFNKNLFSPQHFQKRSLLGPIPTWRPTPLLMCRPRFSNGIPTPLLPQPGYGPPVFSNSQNRFLPTLQPPKVEQCLFPTRPCTPSVLPTESVHLSSMVSQEKGAFSSKSEPKFDAHLKSGQVNLPKSTVFYVAAEKIVVSEDNHRDELTLPSQEGHKKYERDWNKKSEDPRKEPELHQHKSATGKEVKLAFENKNTASQARSSQKLTVQGYCAVERQPKNSCDRDGNVIKINKFKSHLPEYSCTEEWKQSSSVTGDSSSAEATHKPNSQTSSSTQSNLDTSLEELDSIVDAKLGPKPLTPILRQDFSSSGESNKQKIKYIIPARRQDNAQSSFSDESCDYSETMDKIARLRSSAPYRRSQQEDSFSNSSVKTEREKEIDDWFSKREQGKSLNNTRETTELDENEENILKEQKAKCLFTWNPEAREKSATSAHDSKSSIEYEDEHNNSAFQNHESGDVKQTKCMKSGFKTMDKTGEKEMSNTDGLDMNMLTVLLNQTSLDEGMEKKRVESTKCSRIGSVEEGISVNDSKHDIAQAVEKTDPQTELQKMKSISFKSTPCLPAGIPENQVLPYLMYLKQVEEHEKHTEASGKNWTQCSRSGHSEQKLKIENGASSVECPLQRNVELNTNPISEHDLGIGVTKNHLIKRPISQNELKEAREPFDSTIEKQEQVTNHIHKKGVFERQSLFTPQSAMPAGIYTNNLSEKPNLGILAMSLQQQQQLLLLSCEVQNRIMSLAAEEMSSGSGSSVQNPAMGLQNDEILHPPDGGAALRKELTDEQIQAILSKIPPEKHKPKTKHVKASFGAHSSIEFATAHGITGCQSYYPERSANNKELSDKELYSILKKLPALHIEEDEVVIRSKSYEKTLESDSSSGKLLSERELHDILKKVPPSSAEEENWSEGINNDYGKKETYTQLGFMQKTSTVRNTSLTELFPTPVYNRLQQKNDETTIQCSQNYGNLKSQKEVTCSDLPTFHQEVPSSTLCPILKPGKPLRLGSMSQNRKRNFSCEPLRKPVTTSKVLTSLLNNKEERETSAYCFGSTTATVSTECLPQASYNGRHVRERPRKNMVSKRPDNPSALAKAALSGLRKESKDEEKYNNTFPESQQPSFQFPLFPLRPTLSSLKKLPKKHE